MSHIDAAQHRWRRLARWAVKRISGETRGGIAPRFNVAAGFFAPLQTVLRSIERDQIAILLQEHARAHSARIHPGLIGDQANALAAQLRVSVVAQNVDAELHGRARRRAEHEQSDSDCDLFFTSPRHHPN